MTRTRREVQGDDVSSQTSQREHANSELAVSYAEALEGRSRDEDTIIAYIPDASSFGQWRTQLRNALNDKAFLTWLKSDGFDPSTLQITSDGALSVSKNGVLTLFTLKDNSPWATFAGPILAAVKAYAPGGVTWSALHEESAPLKWVAQFYGETIHNDSFEDRKRAQELRKNHTFATAGVGKERTEETLVAQKQQLANKRDLHTFSDSLATAFVKADEYLDKQEALHAYDHRLLPSPPAYDRDAGLQSYLQSQQIRLDPDSGFQLDNQPMAGKQVNLLRFMTGNGWDHPADQAEVKNMLKELIRPTEYRQLYGDLGGGLSWPTPLDSQQQQAIYDAVAYNSMALPEFDKLKLSQNAFGYLTQTIQWSEAELKDPRQAVFRLLQSPTAQAMGEALRTQFEGAGSAEDWALAALQVGLNQDALWKPEEKNKVAGFDLSARENGGKPLSFVLEGLTEHLRKSYGNNAPVAAYLLLSHHAPELLVKDVPDSVTYGSPAWVSLKAIVAKSEMRSPGAAATKTYEQLLKDDLEPITAAEKQVAALAGREGLIHWAVADGAIGKRADNNYTDEEVERAGTLATERFDTLTQASEAQRTELATRKALALNALKERFPVKEYGVIDFEKKAIFPKEQNRDLQGPYSILDIFLQPQQHVEWYSNDPAVPIEKISHELKFIPPVNELFEKQVVDYYDGLKGAMKVTVQHQMSLLSEEDKAALQHGALKIYGEEKVTETIIWAGHRVRYATSETEEVKSSAVFVESLHEGRKRIYEFNPATGGLRYREDLADGLKTGLQGEWSSLATKDSKVTVRTNIKLTEIKANAPADSKERESKPQTSMPIQAFTSARTQHIADAVTSHFFSTKEREQLASAAKGVTTFDTEVTEFEKIQAVTRALIPGAAALHSFQQGRVGEGLTFLAFDIFGFVVAGAGALGKISKIAKVGGQLGKGGVAGRLGRAFISAANPFAGGAAIGTRGLTAFSSVVGKGSLTWKVIAANRSVDRVYQHKPKDVKEGTYQGVDTAKVMAQLDDITGKWYRFDPKTSKRYGTPLQGFTPENSSS
ncbi:hypothetical protein SAMN04490190_1941 [Pseudomonas libanensis]|uniref:Uncharacterized protein n=2 Tax=Pseudomonas libanensis TaxID=75588 RepID=A0A0R2Y095_9PSED|nr:hypothetical protein TU73_25400 [Pseudomonas libanensis]SDK85093.1 hypothetical protein SAMN04490190_1941 [Pseudomonas libanensis]